jgi:hypothetical protein
MVVGIEPIEPVRGKECYVPLSELGPEALFRPDDFISYPSDIWSLACTIWDIIGATSLFIDADQDVLVADQLVALGLNKLREAWRKEWASEGPDIKTTANDEVRPPWRYRREGTYTMLPLEPRFEDDVQYWRRRAERALFEEGEKKSNSGSLEGDACFRSEMPIYHCRRTRIGVDDPLGSLDERIDQEGGLLVVHAVTESGLRCAGTGEDILLSHAGHEKLNKGLRHP